MGLLGEILDFFRRTLFPGMNPYLYFGFVMGSACLVLGVSYSQQIVGFSRIVTAFGVVAVAGSEFPGAVQLSERIEETRAPLSRFVVGEAEKLLRSPGKHPNWELAQYTSAARFHFSDEHRAKVMAMQRQVGYSSNYCWYEFTYDFACHVGSTAWVLLSFAHLKERASPEELQGLIAQQADDGSWPIYYSSDVVLENASTYATTLAVLALDAQRPFLGVAERKQIDSSVQRAVSWLLATRDGSSGGWSDYPLSQHRIQSHALSGMVVYALSRVEAPARTTAIFRTWIANLPAYPEKPSELEVSNTRLSKAGDLVIWDRSRYVVVPWVALGVKAAYRSADWYSRARGYMYVQEFVYDNLLSTDVLSLGFVASEVLLSLSVISDGGGGIAVGGNGSDSRSETGRFASSASVECTPTRRLSCQGL